MSTAPREPAKYHVTAFLKRRDGSDRVEDLGEHEALLGTKAKDKAIALHAERLGWHKDRHGYVTSGWRFEVKLANRDTAEWLRFEVDLMRTVKEYAVVTIDARTEDEARQLAKELLDKEPGRWCDGSPDRVDIQGLKQIP
jgi:hypothetical protein